MKHRSDDGWPDFPVIMGFGSCHTLTDYSPGPATPKRKGKATKTRRIGFHIPKSAPRGKS